MRRLAILVPLAVALVLASFALASAPPAGKYSTKIATPPKLEGTWVLAFAKKAATYTITRNGKVVVRGHDGGGSQILFTNETGSMACPVFGAYTWKRTGKTLTFKKLADDCVQRAYVLGHVFKVAT
jgi:hypothetical protein